MTTPHQALHVHPALTSLSLEACKIRADGAAHLATALAGTRAGPSAPLPPSGPLPLPLSHLNLARNQLGDRGAAALAEALSHARCRCLVSLDLRANGIGLVGCRALGGALRERNGSLRVLAVAGNEMEDDVLQVGRRGAARGVCVAMQKVCSVWESLQAACVCFRAAQSLWRLTGMGYDPPPAGFLLALHHLPSCLPLSAGSRGPGGFPPTQCETAGPR